MGRYWHWKHWLESEVEYLGDEAEILRRGLGSVKGSMEKQFSAVASRLKRLEDSRQLGQTEFIQWLAVLPPDMRTPEFISGALAMARLLGFTVTVEADLEEMIKHLEGEAAAAVNRAEASTTEAQKFLADEERLRNDADSWRKYARLARGERDESPLRPSPL